MVERRVLHKAGEPAANPLAEADRLPSGEGGDVDVAEAWAFTGDDLREFLEADLVGDTAEPAFKARLRESLWEMVKRRDGKPSPDEH